MTGRTFQRLINEEILKWTRKSREYKECPKKVFEEYKKTGKLPTGFTFLRRLHVQKILEKRVANQYRGTEQSTII